MIHVREHNIFERDGSNLYCEVPISFATAALGGEIEVPTLDGRVKLKILLKRKQENYSACEAKVSLLHVVVMRVI